MSVGPLQSWVVYDASSVANFKSWSQNYISANLATMGWTKTSDSGQVTWANVTGLTHLPTIYQNPSYLGFSYRGAWAAPTGDVDSYKGTNTAGVAHGNDVVTSGGLTYQCLSDTKINSTNMTKIFQQPNLTLNIVSNTQSGNNMTLTGVAGGSGGLGHVTKTVASHAVTNSSGGAGSGFLTVTIVGTGFGAATNGLVGYGATTLAFGTPANNVTAVPVTASSESAGNSLITIQNGGAIAGGAEGTIITDFAGWCFHVTGFVNAGNNGYFTVSSSTSTTLVFSTVTPGASNYAGVTETATVTAVSTNTMMTVVLNNGVPNGGNGSAIVAASPTNGVNNYSGLSLTTYSFTNAANNGTFTCLASTPHSVTVTNASGISNGAWVNGAAQLGQIVMVSSPATAGVLYDNVTSPFGFFQPYHYEVWQTNDGFQTIYLRINYSAIKLTASNWYPVISFQIGFTTNGNGWLVSNQVNGAAGNSTALETVVFGNITAVTNPTEVYECTMCGSGTNSSEGAWLSMCMWRTSSSIAQVAALERAKTSSGAGVDTYFTFLTFGKTVTTPLQQSVFKPGSGSQAAKFGVWVYPCCGGSAVLQYNGTNTLLPIFPLVGYMGNPMTAMGVVTSVETTEGQLLTATLYGTSHTYMVTQNTGTSILVANTGTCPALRFEAA